MASCHPTGLVGDVPMSDSSQPSEATYIVPGLRLPCCSLVQARREILPACVRSRRCHAI